MTISKSNKYYFMFSYHDLNNTVRRRELNISINGNPLLIKNPKIAVTVSSVISSKIQELNIDIEKRQNRGESNDPIFDFQIKEIPDEQKSKLIESIKILHELFDGKSIKINKQNYKILLILAHYFKMQLFINSLEEYELFLNNVESDFINSEELMMNFNEQNLNETIEKCKEILNKMSKTLFLYCLIQYCSLHYEKSMLYFSLLQGIDKLNGCKSIEDDESFFNLFFSFLKKSSVLKEKEIDVELLYYYKNVFIRSQKEEQLQKINDSIIKSIEEDNVDNMQSLLVQLNIDINQKIDEIVKNDFSLPKKYNLTYIKYAALKGSVKCFKYLLINNAKIDKDDIALFAVSGGNNEIIRLCEQKKCSFDGTIKLSIKNHYHSITEWLIENNKDKNCIGTDFFVKDPLKYCIKYCNFISLKYVVAHSSDVQRLLTSSAKFNNEILTGLAIKVIKKYNCICISLFDYEYCPISALHISCIRENVETVKLILESKLIDANTKYGILFIIFL